MKRTHVLCGALLTTMLLGAPAFAGEFSIFPAYWNTDVAGKAGGGGLQAGWDFTPMFGMEIRATYFEELTDDPLAAAFDSDDTVFQDKGINVTPLDLGVKLRTPQYNSFRPYVAGGVSYFLLDSDFGDINDETGWYAALGTDIGDNQGVDFFAEALWRAATAQVKLDPEQLDQIDDIDLKDHADVDLDGFGVNLGLRWRFGAPVG